MEVGGGGRVTTPFIDEDTYVISVNAKLITGIEYLRIRDSVYTLIVNERLSRLYDVQKSKMDIRFSL